MQWERGKQQAQFLLRKLNSENVKNYLANEYLCTRIEIAYKIYTNKRSQIQLNLLCGAALLFFLRLFLDFAIKIQIKMNCDCEYCVYIFPLHTYIVRRTMMCFYHSSKFFFSFPSSPFCRRVQKHLFESFRLMFRIMAIIKNRNIQTWTKCFDFFTVECE